MCRLFGFRSNVPSRAHRSLVEAENALAQQAAGHADGWGIGYFLGDEAYTVRVVAGAAADDGFRRVTTRLRSHTMLVHVRRATVGGHDTLNTHPFRHGCWLFAHNGTVWDWERLRPWVLERTEPALRELVFGTTDSEHLFYYLLSALTRAGMPECGRGAVDGRAAAVVIRDAVGAVFAAAAADGQPPPLLNFILTNGQVLLAQRAGQQLFLASQKRLCRDAATCPEPRKVCLDVHPPLDVLRGRALPAGAWRPVNHLLVASEPIGDEDLWEEIPEGVIVALDAQMRLHLLPPAADFAACPSPPAPPPRPAPAPAVGRPRGP